MWFLFLAHVAGDYALQSDHMAVNKGRDPFSLALHVAIYTACIGIALWGYGRADGAYRFASLPVAGLLAPLFLLHGVQDWIKGRHFAQSRQAYYVDQFLHLVQLYVIRLLVI